jgi:hypothetical protein
MQKILTVLSNSPSFYTHKKDLCVYIQGWTTHLICSSLRGTRQNGEKILILLVNVKSLSFWFLQRYKRINSNRRLYLVQTYSLECSVICWATVCSPWREKGFLIQSHHPDGSANHQLLIQLVLKDVSLGTKEMEQWNIMLYTVLCLLPGLWICGISLQFYTYSVCCLKPKRIFTYHIVNVCAQ